ncbi:hypothetical protein HGRIS_010895 [Hohenbuehelia grisea]|uniref:Uncharacterized protein n=1 Tax=Hohenbuehelia grisea TaxID=104357 RepID=A0ABR3IYA8_9AGAR
MFALHCKQISDIYAAALRELGHGHALWVPEPHQSNEVRPGDVGYLHQGAFIRLFSARLPAEHSRNRLFGVPVGFKPLDIPESLVAVVEKYFDPGTLRSCNIQETKFGVAAEGCGLPGSAGIQFTCSDRQGAVLLLTRKGIREDILALDLCKEYAKEHYESWYDFANRQLRLGLNNGDIILVTGCDKTAEWATAAFNERSRGVGISFYGGFPMVGGAEVSLSGSWQTGTSVQHRSGPVSDCGDVKYDQTIFIRSYKVKESITGAPKVIRAASEPRDDERSGPEQDSLAVPVEDPMDAEDDAEEDDDPLRVFNALDALADHILENSDADLAIVHDNDLYADTPRLVGMDTSDTSQTVADIVQRYEDNFFARDRRSTVTIDGLCPPSPLEGNLFNGNLSSGIEIDYEVCNHLELDASPLELTQRYEDNLFARDRRSTVTIDGLCPPSPLEGNPFSGNLSSGIEIDYEVCNHLELDASPLAPMQHNFFARDRCSTVTIDAYPSSPFEGNLFNSVDPPSSFEKGYNIFMLDHSALSFASSSLGDSLSWESPRDDQSPFPTSQVPLSPIRPPSSSFPTYQRVNPCLGQSFSDYDSEVEYGGSFVDERSLAQHGARHSQAAPTLTTSLLVSHSARARRKHCNFAGSSPRSRSRSPPPRNTCSSIYQEYLSDRGYPKRMTTPEAFIEDAHETSGIQVTINDAAPCLESASGDQLRSHQNNPLDRLRWPRPVTTEYECTRWPDPRATLRRRKRLAFDGREIVNTMTPSTDDDFRRASPGATPFQCPGRKVDASITQTREYGMIPFPPLFPRQ